MSAHMSPLAAPRLRRVLALALVALFTTDCRKRVAPPQEAEVDVRKHSKEAKALKQLGDRYVELMFERDPINATFAGDRRFDRRLPDLSRTALQKHYDTLREFHVALVKMDIERLTPDDALSRRVLLQTLDGMLASEICHLEWWDINALSGIQTTLGELPQLHAIHNRAQAEALAERYRASGPWLDAHVANLRQGMEKGYLAASVSVARVIEQLDGFLATPAEQSPYVDGVNWPAAFDAKTKETLRAELLKEVQAHVYPALTRYRDFLKNDYAAKARKAVGVSNNPDGLACYAARTLATTGLPLVAGDVHTIGLEASARIDAEMQKLSEQLAGTKDMSVLTKQLETDPKQLPADRDALMRAAQAIIERAQAAMPRAFGDLSPRKVQVKAIEAFREKDAPSGYYYDGDEAGTRPGYFYLNTYLPERRPLYQLESLAFHEAVPGHHTQVSFSQDLEDLPRFRKLFSQGAYVEGWALYAERLADELELYSGPEARFGMFSSEALRAARLVVDTGLHTLNWTRDQAIAYLRAHTAEPDEEIAREVDRYIAWPAQALAYMTGQREILQLRAQAQRELGPRFDLKRFHQTVLQTGSVPLGTLREEVQAWIEAEAEVGAGMDPNAVSGDPSAMGGDDMGLSTLPFE